MIYYGARAYGRTKEELTKLQIRIVCDMGKISYDETFVNYVYNKHLKMFSIANMEELKKQYEEKI